MKRGTLLALFVFLFLVLSLQAPAQISFFQPPMYAGSGANVFVADFNGDGKPDILTSDTVTWDGILNLGNGDGTFRQGTTVSGTPLAVADFNGDGKPDILEQGTGTLLVLLGNGDGTFRAPISTASGASLLSVAATDLNGDGKADVVGIFNNALVVYIGKGDGTFAPGVSYSLGTLAPTFPVSLPISFGDFNGDGKIDVAVSGAGAAVNPQEVVFLGNGDGTFQSPKYSNGVASNFAAVGDFNGDGKLDLALSPSDLYVMLGNGDGTFQSPTAAFAGTVGSGPMFAADVNGDGKLDLVIQSEDATVAQVFLGNGNGTFSNASNYVLQGTGATLYGVELAPGGSAIGDFNQDGKADIAAGNRVLLGNGDGTFQGIPLAITPNTNGTAVLGGFENKGTLDLAVFLGIQGLAQVSIFSNNGQGLLSPTQSYPLQDGGEAIATADFNGDGNLDLVVGEWNSVTLNWSYSVLLGNGDGTFQAPVYYPQSVVGDPISIMVGDFNNDHKLDLAIGLFRASQSVAVLLGNGDGTFAAPVYYFSGGAISNLLMADFNGDGNSDIAVGYSCTTSPVGYSCPPPQTAILFGNGDGTFQSAVFPPSLKGFGAVFTADLNNDGKPDFVVEDYQNNAWVYTVALNNGDGTFKLLSPLSYQVTGGLADVTGDGNVDAVVNGGILPGNGDGTFGNLVSIPNLFQWGPFLFGDVNGNGRTDIVFPWARTYGWGVLLNTAPPDFRLSASTASKTVTAGHTAQFSLTIAPMRSFTGTVNLACAVTPVVTPAPTCNLSSSSVQISGSGSQSVTVTVATTASGTSGTAPYNGFPTGTTMVGWAMMLAGLGYLLVRTRKRIPVLAAPAITLALLTWTSCGGGGSSQHTTTGTPSGTYTATVTATSGTSSHAMPLQVVVQ